MLTAKRPMPDLIPEVIYVLSDEISPEDGNVVAKHNTKVGQTWRTKHVGPKPSLSDIRAAIATVAS